MNYLMIIILQVSKNTSHMCCSMSLEHSLFILLLDGLTNNSKEYLRLHRKIAPFKISFALNYKGIFCDTYICTSVLFLHNTDLSYRC